MTEQHDNPYESPSPRQAEAIGQTSSLAIVSLILSCASVLLGPFGSLPGIVCGHLARAQCRRDPRLAGSGIALAGLIVGYLSLVFSLLLIAVGLIAIFGAGATTPFVYTLY